MSDAELAIVATFPNHIEAELARGALEAGGIDSVISADDAGGMPPHFSLLGVRLLVRSADVEQAARILEQSAPSEPHGK